MHPRALIVLAGILVLLPGCASTSPKAALQDVSKNVLARSGHQVQWDPNSELSRETEAALDRLLAGELTADTAVKVALLANPSLQATLEEVAISQADLVQAGLLKNPSLTIGKTAWESEHLSPNLFATIEQDFLDILTMPLRKRVAATELEATKLQVGDHVLELAAEVREAFYTAQAAEQVALMRRLVDEASKTSSEIARQQHEAGNMSDLNFQSELTLAAQTSLDRTRAEGEAAVARERLNKLMGLWGRRTAWKSSARLPELPREETGLDQLETAAIGQRLDMGAARRNVQAMEYALNLAKTTRWVGSVNVAVDAGRLRGTNKLSFGPSVTLEIPLFDQRQAQIARLEAFKRQGEKQLRALAIDIRADVRSARARVLTARALVEEYQRVVVPTRENVVRFSQQHYDAMLLGVYQLIQAKQSEYDAYSGLIEAVRDYWVARSDLERAVAGPVRGTAPSPGKREPTGGGAPSPAHSH